jgi:hypothetical protein
MDGYTISSTVECIHVNENAWTFKTDGREANVYIQTELDIQDPMCIKTGNLFHCHIDRHASDTWTIRKEA